MGDIRRKADIGNKLAEERKKQELKNKELANIMGVDKVDPNPNLRRAGEIKQKARELEKINKGIERLQKEFNNASR